jgi:membrane protein YdbS with pleckstrin-like domain
MKTIASKAKRNWEVILITTVMVTLVTAIIHNSIVYGTYSSPW